jgi:hypothetical protein
MPQFLDFFFSARWLALASAIASGAALLTCSSVSQSPASQQPRGTDATDGEKSSDDVLRIMG